jgi:hypothetical protein
VLDWRIISSDNILVGLLSHNLDQLALDNMGFFSHFLDKELLIFCMMHGNIVFL